MHNPALAKNLLERASMARLNISDLAERLGVAPSTLSRSLKEESFSGNLARMIELALKNSEIFASNWSSPEAIREIPAKIGKKELQILHKFVNLLPTAEEIIKSLVQTSSRRKKA
jgi:transcriptional regulator with XRE-family HTH domain